MVGLPPARVLRGRRGMSGPRGPRGRGRPGGGGLPRVSAPRERLPGPPLPQDRPRRLRGPAERLTRDALGLPETAARAGLHGLDPHPALPGARGVAPAPAAARRGGFRGLAGWSAGGRVPGRGVRGGLPGAVQRVRDGRAGRRRGVRRPRPGGSPSGAVSDPPGEPVPSQRDPAPADRRDDPVLRPGEMVADPWPPAGEEGRKSPLARVAPAPRADPGRLSSHPPAAARLAGCCRGPVDGLADPASPGPRLPPASRPCFRRGPGGPAGSRCLRSSCSCSPPFSSAPSGSVAKERSQSPGRTGRRRWTWS